MLILIVLILIIVSICAQFNFFYNRHKTYDAVVLPEKQIDVSELKTGDIIAVSYNGLRTIFSKIAYGSIWTHVGILFVTPENGEIFVFEASNYDKPYKGSVLRVPLLYWMQVNRNANKIAILKINKPIDAKTIDGVYKKYEKLNIGVSNLDLSWLRFLSKTKPTQVPNYSLFADKERKLPPEKAREEQLKLLAFKAKKNYIKFLSKIGIHYPNRFPEENHDYILTCNEVLVAVLQDLGVFSPEYTPCSFLPSDIVRRDIETINGYSYDCAQAVSVKALGETIRML